jgi:hypothetical protein
MVAALLLKKKRGQRESAKALARAREGPAVDPQWTVGGTEEKQEVDPWQWELTARRLCGREEGAG